MAPKNNTDRINELAADVVRYGTRLDERSEMFGAADAESRRHIELLRADVQELKEQFAVLRRDADERNKGTDESSRRRWVVIGALVGAAFSLVG